MTPPGRADLSLPLNLGLSALLLLLALQNFQLVRERGAIADALASQEAGTLEGDRVRRQLDGLLTGVSSLAGQGDAAAQSVLDGLRRQGIVYTPPARNS